MSKSRLVLTIDTNVPVGTLQDILTENGNSLGITEELKIVNFLRHCLSGTFPAIIHSGVVDSGATDALSAAQTYTFSGVATAGDTVTINGVVFTAVSNVTVPVNDQFRVGLTASDSAANLAAAINASTDNNTCGTVHATSLVGVTTVTASFPGVMGNSILLSKSSSVITLGGPQLAGGHGRLPLLHAFHYAK